MKFLKPGLAVLALIAGFSGQARAQKVGVVNKVGPVNETRGYATYPGYGTNLGYYSIDGGFGNYGLPGTYPNYNGYGFSGYGPGSPLNGYFTASPNPSGGRVSNNMGGLINVIRQNTGKSGSIRSNAKPAVPPARRAR